MGWFSNRTGMSVDNGPRKSNNWLPRAFPSSNDVPVLFLNQRNIRLQAPKLARNCEINIGMPVVRTVRWSVYGHVIAKFTKMDRHPDQIKNYWKT